MKPSRHAPPRSGSIISRAWCPPPPSTTSRKRSTTLSSPGTTASSTSNIRSGETSASSPRRSEPASPRRTGRRRPLGEHTDALLAEIGCDAGEIRRLRGAGVV